jgi:hypothetical protein
VRYDIYIYIYIYVIRRLKVNTDNTGNKKFPFSNIRLAHMHGRHGNIYRRTHKIMTAGDTVLILPCDMQILTVQATAMCRYDDNVSLSIQFHRERANYTNINLGVHHFCYKNIGTCNCEHICACFLMRTQHTYAAPNASMHVATVILGTKHKTVFYTEFIYSFPFKEFHILKTGNTFSSLQPSHRMSIRISYARSEVLTAVLLKAQNYIPQDLNLQIL